MTALLSRQRRGIVGLVVLALVMGTLAFFHKGVPAAQLQLHDGGVWVTNQVLKLVGHLNYPSRTLDGGVRADSGDFDVSQAGNTVLLHNDGSGKVQSLDTAVLALGDSTSTKDGIAISQGGELAAASDARAGKLWIMKAADVGGFTPEAIPTMEKMPGVRTIVGLDGVVHAITPDGVVRRIADGKATDDGRIEGLGDLATASMTTVGDVLVVLDRAGSSVRTNKGSASVQGADKLVLQLPGPKSDRVLVAGPDTYSWIPLGGGNATTIKTASGVGVPAAPAVLNSCGYLAWSGSGDYVRDCADDATDMAQTVDKLKGFGQIAFRVNRDVIVLNDLANGVLLLVNDKMRVVDNWPVIESSTKQKEDQTTTTTTTTEELAAQEKSKENTKPEAKDDDFGVRPGRTVTLGVLENDSDADGDLLTASLQSNKTNLTINPVRGGEALSVVVPEAATGSFTFTYLASDGRGESDDASVRVTVFPSTTNGAPTQKRISSVKLAVYGEVSYSILGDFRDPESDSLYLASVEAPAGLQVRFRPDGVITVKDLGTGGVGVKDVKVSVTDGSNTAVGVLKVNVVSEKPAPIANTDHVTALKGQDVVVRPLANDVDPVGGILRLTTVAPAGAGQTIKPDYASGTFTFSSTTVGSTYVSYSIANDSPTPATGYVRIDVTDPSDGPPIPSDDLAMMPAGGWVISEPLENDTDPSGGVLVLKSVSVPSDVGVAVEIINHATLRISAPAGLSTPVDCTYVVANGSGEAIGRVTVIPLPPTGNALPPTAVNDRAVVRVGDIVTIPAIDNDLSPSGLPLSLDPKVTIEGDAAAGDAFVSRDVVRFRAKKPGTIRVNYTVRDTNSGYATAQIVLTVNPIEAQNTPPLPQPIVGRVLAGGTVTIPVPLDGVDPDGDSVTFVGLGSGATKGTAVAGPEGITYSAPVGASGTDTFIYQVADRFGQLAESSVRVGIASPNATNQSPVALPDDVATRPGRALSVNAIANDTDADGDELSIVPGSVVPADDHTTAPASIENGLIDLKTPAEEGALRYYYSVTDGHGVPVKGVVTVRVSKDAVLKPPIARDDVVTEAQIKDKTSVTVDVLANDYDPDGTVKDLTLESSDPGVSVDAGRLVVTVTDQRQVVLYTVKDLDGNTARAAVIVPPSDRGLPYVDSTKIPLRVKAGELLTVPLTDVVIVRSGRTPMITFPALAKAGPGADPTEPVKDARTLQFRSVVEFSGLSSITFQVTDGTSPEDPAGHLATLTVPIIVEAAPAALHQPVFRPSDVKVAQGEKPVAVDLKAMASDQDPGDDAKLKFDLGSVTGGFTVRLVGTTLEVSAPVNAPAGTSGTAVVSVTDGSTPPVQGTMQLSITASTRPLISIKTATISDAKAGSPSTIDLTSYISNPFSAEGKPVTILPQASVTGGSAQVSFSGLAAKITPPPGFHGQLVVTYTAQDATEAPSRQVRGTINVTVRDKPDAPTAVIAETHLSRTVTVSWSAGPNNGAPITGFTVYWAGGSKACGQATNCLIDGLVNNTVYTFQVTATNEVSESDKSAASNSVRPDVKPNPPGTPVGTFGDKQIALTWAASTTDGSPVTGYTIEISPGAGGTNRREVTGTSYTWTGLQNGTSYTFRVQAKSSASTPSDWSGASTGVVPAGLPFQPAAPKANKDPVSNTAPSATVSWTAPDGNGDSNLTFEMRRTGTSTVLYSGTGTSAHVTLSVSTTDQSFEVRAKNKAGWGPWSPASNAIRAFQTPGAVTNLSVTPTGANNTVKITFGAAAGNGATAGEMTYYWKANGVTQSIPAGGTTVANGTAFPNGANVSVAVYAVSNVKGESAQGTSTSATVNAYGPPVSPTVTCTGGDQSVSCNWSGGNANGRPTTFVYSGDVSGSGPASGSYTFGSIGYAASRTLCLQAQQNTGLTGARICGSGRSADPPPPTPPSLTLSKGASAQGRTTWDGIPCSSACYYLTATTANFSGNVSCRVTSGTGSTWTMGGAATKQTTYFFGYPGQTVTARCAGPNGEVANGAITW